MTGRAAAAGRRRRRPRIDALPQRTVVRDQGGDRGGEQIEVDELEYAPGGVHASAGYSALAHGRRIGRGVGQRPREAIRQASRPTGVVGTPDSGHLRQLRHRLPVPAGPGRGGERLLIILDGRRRDPAGLPTTAGDAGDRSRSGCQSRDFLRLVAAPGRHGASRRRPRRRRRGPTCHATDAMNPSGRTSRRADLGRQIAREIGHRGKSPVPRVLRPKLKGVE